LSKDAALYDEPRHLLREGEGIRDPGTCLSILRAIAHGAAQHNEIAQQAKAASASLGAKLARLEDPFFRFGSVTFVSTKFLPDRLGDWCADRRFHCTAGPLHGVLRLAHQPPRSLGRTHHERLARSAATRRGHRWQSAQAARHGYTEGAPVVHGTELWAALCRRVRAALWALQNALTTATIYAL